MPPWIRTTDNVGRHALAIAVLATIVAGLCASLLAVGPAAAAPVKRVVLAHDAFDDRSRETKSTAAA